MIISLLIGYITAMLPIWDWNTRLELFAGTIVLSITCLAILIWLQEKRKVIKKALLSGLRYTVKSEIINDNMTEAAGRELYKEFKNK